jgi:Type I phosphodiesterase / nucleotide pyrophosphatase
MRIQSLNAVAPQHSELDADATPNVLVIGVDGTNLARILADPANVNFVEVMQGGTTAAASIAGHTTLSNPSWTAVLTGLWGETTGVINNIFNPAVYDSWPTVFNQLESLDPAIHTTAIANWDVVAAIAASGSIPADSVRYVPQLNGDTNWLLTDDAVGDATEAAIAAADPATANFVFSYFVGVDENGHLYGGASPQYADAVQNIDRNLGEILQTVNDWEAATGEQWTILIVTDHGHQPQVGFGHGFQSPDETTTFVIANNPDRFTAGGVNTAYQIVDVTPTVVTIFGGVPVAHSDGVSMTTLNGSTTAYGDTASLIQALQVAIDDVDHPDPVTELALGVRTVFASIPYFLVDIVDGVVGELRAVSAQDTLLSPLAYLAIGPVQFAGDALYVATNVLAQVVARLTGVTGASIFPLLPPELPDLQMPDLTTLVGVWCVPAVSGAASVCGAQSVAV